LLRPPGKRPQGHDGSRRDHEIAPPHAKTGPVRSELVNGCPLFALTEIYRRGRLLNTRLHRTADLFGCAN
jgi:hypothetical protein